MSNRKYGVHPIFGWRQVVLLITSPGPAMLAIAEGDEVEVPAVHSGALTADPGLP